MQEENQLQQEAESSIETDIGKYELNIREYARVQSSVEYSKSKDVQLRFPHLYAVALDLYTAPASEAYCEQIFSLAGDQSANKRNRASKCLEMKTFLKLNQRLLTKSW